MIHAAFGCYLTIDKRSVLAVLAKTTFSFVTATSVLFLHSMQLKHTQSYTFHKDTWPGNEKRESALQHDKQNKTEAVRRAHGRRDNKVMKCKKALRENGNNSQEGINKMLHKELKRFQRGVRQSEVLQTPNSTIIVTAGQTARMMKVRNNDVHAFVPLPMRPRCFNQD